MTDTSFRVRYRFGPFQLDPAERLLLKDGVPVALTRKAFDTLLYLVGRGGRLVSRDELIRAVWPDAIVEEGNLHWMISTLRKALGSPGRGEEALIQTVHGVGYRFRGPVEVDGMSRPGAAVGIPPAAGAPPAAVPDPPVFDVGPPAAAWRGWIIVAAVAVLAVAVLFLLLTGGIRGTGRLRGPAGGPSKSGLIHISDSPGSLARRLLEFFSMEDAAWSRRNGAIPDEMLDRLLARHRALHPLDKPLVEADYRHALDVWQWVLRLEPEAGAAVQIAALFHDIERVFTEAESRSEQAVADYDDYKARHAARSAWITAAVLREEKLDPALAARAVELIAGHDQPGRVNSAGKALSEDPDAALLEDADALSFLSLNSAGYLRYYGEEQARRKVEWTLARLSPRGRERLAGLDLLPPAPGVRSPS